MPKFRIKFSEPQDEITLDVDQTRDSKDKKSAEFVIEQPTERVVLSLPKDKVKPGPGPGGTSG